MRIIKKFGLWISVIIFCAIMIYMVLPSGTEVTFDNTTSNSSKSAFKVWIQEMVKSNDMDNRDSETSSSSSNSIQVEDDLQVLVNMPAEERYSYVTGGLITKKDWSSKSFSQLESTLNSLKTQNEVTITVPMWQWENPNGSSTDLSKKSVTVSVTVSKYVADLWEAALKAVYNDPSQPVLYYSGGWNVRKVNNGSGSARASGHSLGTTVDFNTSNCTLTNSLGHKLSNWNQASSEGRGIVKATAEEWNALPECQAKYNIFYEDSPVVKILNTYGIYWGGSWGSNYDGMHFYYCGDN